MTLVTNNNCYHNANEMGALILSQGGIWSFIDDIKQHVLSQMPKLIDGELYCMEEIFAEEFWLMLLDYDQTAAAEQCMEVLINYNQLPLGFAGENDANACLYYRA